MSAHLKVLRDCTRKIKIKYLLHAGSLTFSEGVISANVSFATDVHMLLNAPWPSEVTGVAFYITHIKSSSTKSISRKV